MSSSCSTSTPSPSILTGDADEDFATLNAMVDVDCDAEPQCGPMPPHCMAEALHAGVVGKLTTSGPPTKVLFTLDGDVVVFSPGLTEALCGNPRLVTIATGAECWYVSFECG